MTDKVMIRRLPTGVPGMDEMLGGGIPEFSFNLIAGVPGSGKTTLAHQMMFSLVSPTCKALYFTVVGEPPLKMLRYQQQFPFFDIHQLNKTVRYVNLADDLNGGDFDQVMRRIDQEVRDFSPSLVFVDSFRSVVQASQVGGKPQTLQHFIQQLGLMMTSWQATTFLIGEYATPEAELSPIFTVADGIFWISQLAQGDSVVRKIQAVKMRGQAQRLGLHTFRIGSQGVEIFPRVMLDASPAPVEGDPRLSIGVTALDEMMGGGLPTAYSLLLVGPSGSGKTVLATQFLEAGVQRGEPGVIAAFEKSPNRLLSHKLNQMTSQGLVTVLDTRALDLSIDEILHDLVALINRTGAKRVVIDSLSGFELSLAPAFRADFREALYRLVSVLTGMGVTVVMTAELEDRYTDLRFSAYGNAFLADAILMQRYAEVEGRFRRVLSVVKIRGSSHSKELRFYDIVDGALQVEESTAACRNVLSGRIGL